MKTLILTNGSYGNYSFCKAIASYDYVICADNGLKHAKTLNIIPNLIVGDFDSTSKEDLEYFRTKEVCIEKLPCEKDETDTEVAVERAISLGSDWIDIWGGVGTRLDHTLGNVHLLYKALEKGVKASLHNSCNSVYIIDKRIELKGEKGDLVSLLPLSVEVTGVTTSHLAYPLEGATFKLGKPYGISNYMLEETATVAIKKGILLVIKAKDE